MRQYFRKMTPIGKALSASESKQAEANALAISKVDQEIAAALENRQKTGIPAEVVHKRGEKTAWERIDLNRNRDALVPGVVVPSAVDNMSPRHHFILAARKSGSARMRLCMGMEVWIPSTMNMSSARFMRATASARSWPWVRSRSPPRSWPPPCRRTTPPSRR